MTSHWERHNYLPSSNLLLSVHDSCIAGLFQLTWRPSKGPPTLNLISSKLSTYANIDCVKTTLFKMNLDCQK